MANKNPNTPPRQADTYTHSQQAVQRPDVGVQPEFTERKGAKRYRYDSSLAPELCWDENAERELAEWLLERIAEAVEQGEPAVFSEPQRWQGSDETFASIAECVARLKSLTQPFLNWTGKAERREISVPTIPLFVHERHATRAILETLDSYKAAGTNLDLFGDPELDIADKLDAYEHKGPWTNRMVLGDSLQVMNSLLEYEGLGGQVQMIYMDPPYGVKFGSNFQPFVRKRDVKHGKDDEMIREPEMVKAYRDTWELGLHSYLTYLRDRLLLARELLTESGSIFVQISDENLHHVREIMDEVFGEANYAGTITFFKTSSQSTKGIPAIADMLLVYSNNKELMKYRPLLVMKKPGEAGAKQYKKIISPDMREIRNMTRGQLSGNESIPDGWHVCRLGPTTSQGYQENRSKSYLFEGEQIPINLNLHWKYDPTPGEDMDRLYEKGRLKRSGKGLATVLLASDNPTTPLDNIWMDTGTGSFTEDQHYVVQTAQKAIQRCMLMTTDPGDLVFDPTCGSGTSAYVAEQWGRRWITCDTSRVPLALARQRLLTATFPWYELKEPQHGPAGGFVYQPKQNRKGEEVGGLVPRITLKSIANDEEPETVTLVDKPEQNKKVTRVCGPFSVEATVQAAGSMLEEQDGVKEMAAPYENPRTYLDRMIEVLRQSHTLRLPGNKALQLAQVRPLAAEDYEHLHAEAVEQNGEDRRIAVMFGPQDGAIDSATVLEAAREAWYSQFDALYFFGFAIQAKARELVENHGKLKLPCTYVAVTPDVVMSDLLKTSKASEIFSITGLPDVDFRPNG
ncbi:MAG: site-specific DNA-methyltransferase [Pseudomonadota bacterium]|nr:site-specific DNA-methyltransferase [Pseudomonadota bacterium]